MIGGAGPKPWGILALDSSGLRVTLKIMSGLGGTNSTYNKMLGIQSRTWILPVRVSRVWTAPSFGESACCTSIIKSDFNYCEVVKLIFMIFF